MLKLDNNLLDELGLGSLPDDQKRAMLQHIYETLELRVGTNLANQMSDQQLEEFEKFIDDGGDANQAQALQWLESNLPNYKQVVNEVFDALKGEIKQMAPQLVAASQQPSAVPAQAPQQQQGFVPPAPTPQQPVAPTGYQPPMPQQPVADPYTPPASQTGQSMAQPYPPLATTGQSLQEQQVQAADEVIAQQQAAQPYQFPQQQPPAGPGQPPQYPTQ